MTPMMHLRGILLCSCAIFLAAGCEKEEEKTEAQKNQDLMAGTWKSNCVTEVKGVDEDPESEMTTYVFAESNFSMGAMMYNGDTCTTPFMTIDGTGTWEMSASATAGTSNFDATIATMALTPGTDFASKLNSMSLCGKTDWADGVKADVTGLTCTFGDKDPDGLPTAVGSKMYDIIAVVGNTFTMGDEGENGEYNGFTVEKRPVALRADLIFTKQ